MTALTLTTLPDTAAVAVQVTGAPAGAVAITRTDANGANPVRLRSGQTPIDGAMTAIDFEAALVGSLRYDVVDATGASVTATITLAGVAAPGPRLGGVQSPQLAHTPRVVTGYRSARASGSTVLRVIGRGDPVVLLGPTRTREGTLELFSDDYADAAAAERVLSEARMLMLRQPDHPGMDMYFVPDNIGTDPLELTDAGWRWVTSCSYVEVRSPALPLLGGAGWTFDEVGGGWTDFAALRTAFDDFAAMVIGP